MPAYTLLAGSNFLIRPASQLKLLRIPVYGSLSTGFVLISRYASFTPVGGSATSDFPLSSGDRSSGCTVLVTVTGASSSSGLEDLGSYATDSGMVEFENLGMDITVPAGSYLWITASAGVTYAPVYTV